MIPLRPCSPLFPYTTLFRSFTASLVQEDAPERLWNPSELFTRHYQETNNSPLTQKAMRSEEHTSELQSRRDLVCRLLLEKKKKAHRRSTPPTTATTTPACGA